MENKDYKAHYQKDAELFSYFENDKYDIDYNRRLHTCIKKMVMGSGNKILDIGSGGGWSVSELSKNGQLFLIDLSQKNLKTIKLDSNAQAAVGDAIQLPFKENCFDYVIISEVLEHINNPAQAILDAFRVLKKGGKIIISTPYNEKIRYYLCIHCNQMTPANAHLHSFNITSMQEICKDLNTSSIIFHKFGSKLLTATRISYLLRWLPYWLWRSKDKFLNLIIDKPNTLITVIKKS